MKKTIISSLVIIISFFLCAAASTDNTSYTCCCTDGVKCMECHCKTVGPIEQIDILLQGTWSDPEADASFREKYTFYNGNCLEETFSNGVLRDSSKGMKTYMIGAETIHVITIDQRENVEGYFRYSFENGVLRLFSFDGEDELTKE